MSLSGDGGGGGLVAIGAKSNDGNGSYSGHTRVFEWDGSSWVQKGGDIDGKAAGDQSWFSVSLSSDGKVVAFGAYLNGAEGAGTGQLGTERC